MLGMLQVKERLLKILTFWADRKLYDKDTMQQLEAALLSGDPNAMLQAPALKQVSSTEHATACHAGIAIAQASGISLLRRQRVQQRTSLSGVLCPHAFIGRY